MSHRSMDLIIYSLFSLFVCLFVTVCTFTRHPPTAHTHGRINVICSRPRQSRLIVVKALPKLCQTASPCHCWQVRHWHGTWPSSRRSFVNQRRIRWANETQFWSMQRMEDVENMLEKLQRGLCFTEQQLGY